MLVCRIRCDETGCSATTTDKNTRRLNTDKAKGDGGAAAARGTHLWGVREVAGSHCCAALLCSDVSIGRQRGHLPAAAHCCVSSFPKAGLRGGWLTGRVACTSRQIFPGIASLKPMVTSKKDYMKWRIRLGKCICVTPVP